jgi:hypothetical protein
MTDKKGDEGIEFILQHWNLVSQENKKLLEALGISPNNPKYAGLYEKTIDHYETPQDAYSDSRKGQEA